MGWQRNQFDRLVHFLYGLLLAYPLREIYLQVADARGFWGYFLQLDVTVTSSAMYEMVEWLAAVMFGGELGVAYLGTQCDVRDAQKDMLMAGLGAALAMSITAAINIRFQRDFAREWQESLRVKIPHSAGRRRGGTHAARQTGRRRLAAPRRKCVEIDAQTGEWDCGRSMAIHIPDAFAVRTPAARISSRPRHRCSASPTRFTSVNHERVMHEHSSEMSGVRFRIHLRRPGACEAYVCPECALLRSTTDGVMSDGRQTPA
jgi:hypothetical protein